jgi:hypothetical protein
MSFSESKARRAVSMKGGEYWDAHALFGQHGNVRVRTIHTFSGRQEKTALISHEFENTSDEFQVNEAAERFCP